MFPVWLSFKGGKGMATALGVDVGSSPGQWARSPAQRGCWSPPLFRYSSLATC
jgi:glycerol-3-phosphate acyltransferase PlsY